MIALYCNVKVYKLSLRVVGLFILFIGKLWKISNRKEFSGKLFLFAFMSHTEIFIHNSRVVRLGNLWQGRQYSIVKQ